MCSRAPEPQVQICFVWGHKELQPHPLQWAGGMLWRQDWCHDGHSKTNQNQDEPSRLSVYRKHDLNMYGFWDGKTKRIIFNSFTIGYNWGTCQSCCGQDWLGQQDVWNPDSSPWVQHEVHIRSIWNLRQVRSMVQQESEWKNDQDLRIGQQEDVKSSILIYAWFILILTLFSFSLSLWTYNIIKE